MIVAVRCPVTELLSPHRSRIERVRTDWIVIHCTAGHEGPTTAEACARMFADPALKPRRSAHRAGDSNSSVRCVPDLEVAWAAGHTANARGWHIELTGLPTQTAEQWHDPDSLAELGNGAQIVAEAAHLFSIPLVFVTAADMLRGARGVTTHAEESKAWRQSDHTDPGPFFPMDEFVAAARLAQIAT